MTPTPFVWDSRQPLSPTPVAAATPFSHGKCQRAVGRSKSAVEGDRRAYERLAGVHRVQRIPKNDRRGRRHTSTATVAVIEKQSERVVEIADEDIDVFTYRGSGKGGQHRNKTESAVRVVHRPTGQTVVVEHGRSQWQNLQQAKMVLVQRLRKGGRRADSAKVSNDRNRQIAGERLVKQFTHSRATFGGRVARDGGSLAMVGLLPWTP